MSLSTCLQVIFYYPPIVPEFQGLPANPLKVRKKFFGSVLANVDKPQIDLHNLQRISARPHKT